MGLFNREETEKQQLKRLSKHAGNVVEMLKGTLKGPQGTDMTIVLLYAAGLAGCACHEAEWMRLPAPAAPALRMPLRRWLPRHGPAPLPPPSAWSADR